MKKRGADDLAMELRQAGADDHEVPALMSVAAQLSKLNEAATPNPMSQPAGWFYRLALPLAGGLAGLTVGVALAVTSQSVLPNNWLFPVQKLSDDVVIRMRPQYRVTVMMKRSQQVNSLATTHADARWISAALKDYQDEAKSYATMPHMNYAAFEFCKSNLEQAAKASPPHVREQIETVLKSLDTD